MSELTMKRPKTGWSTVAFGDVVRQVKDKVDPEDSGLERYVAGEHMDTDDLRIRRWGQIGEGYLGPAFHMRFKPGHVLYGSRRTYLRKVAVADFEGITANTTYVLESADPKVLLPELLPFIMQTDAFSRHSARESKGSVNPYVNFSDLAWFEFALPPIEEQRRISHALRACKSVLERLEELIETTRFAEASAFEAMTSHAQVPVVELGSLLQCSPRNGCSAPPASTETGHWVLALSAISRWGYRAGELKPVKPTNVMLQAQISAGDLVISRSNTRELVGLPAVFPEDRTDVAYPDTMMRLRLDATGADVHFIELALRSRRCRRQIQSFAAGTSASMKKINGSNLKKVQVPNPSLCFQRQIVACLSQFRDQIAFIVARRMHAQRVTAQLLKLVVNDERGAG